MSKTKKDTEDESSWIILEGIKYFLNEYGLIVLVSIIRK